VAVPLVLVGGLALGGGGYGVDERHVAGIAAWLGIIVLIALGQADGTPLRLPIFLAGGGLLALAILQAASAGWSDSPEASVLEADRTLTYLGILLLGFVICRTEEGRQGLFEGIALAAAAIALLGLASRLLPDLVGSNDPDALSDPLGYKNATGLASGLALPLLLWLGRYARAAPLRAFAVACMPAVMVAIYLSLSRGGVLGAAIGLGTLAVLGGARLWQGTTTLVAALLSAPAVLLAERWSAVTAGTTGDADRRLVILVLVILAGIATVAIAAQLARRAPRTGIPVPRALARGRGRRVLLPIGIVAVALLAVAGARLWSDFATEDLVPQPARTGGHFAEISSGGRVDIWEVALDGFAEHPLLGEGAGTFHFLWDRERPSTLEVKDGHSLYLESLAELGMVGAVLTFCLVGGLAAASIRVSRRSGGPLRDATATCAAVLTAFAVCAALDWHWEVAGLGAIFFLVAGPVLALLCEGVPVRLDRRPLALAVAVAVFGWVAVAALTPPLIAERQLQASLAAALVGDLATARERAQTAANVEPWAAAPYVQLGLIDRRAGRLGEARRDLNEAVKREPGNWENWYLRGQIEREIGLVGTARGDLRRARLLHPLFAAR
jgi:O-antigen ligase